VKELQAANTDLVSKLDAAGKLEGELLAKLEEAERAMLASAADIDALKTRLRDEEEHQLELEQGLTCARERIDDLADVKKRIESLRVADQAEFASRLADRDAALERARQTSAGLQAQRDKLEGMVFELQNQLEAMTRKHEALTAAHAQSASKRDVSANDRKLNETIADLEEQILLQRRYMVKLSSAAAGPVHSKKMGPQPGRGMLSDVTNRA